MLRAQGSWFSSQVMIIHNFTLTDIIFHRCEYVKCFSSSLHRIYLYLCFDPFFLSLVLAFRVERGSSSSDKHLIINNMSSNDKDDDYKIQFRINILIIIIVILMIILLIIMITVIELIATIVDLLVKIPLQSYDTFVNENQDTDG